MENQYPSKRPLLKNKFLRFLVIEIGALLVSFFIIFGLGVFLISYAGDLYNAKHAIPDPVIRGEDLGLGFTMVGGAMLSLFFSLPISIAVHIYFFKKFF